MKMEKAQTNYEKITRGKRDPITTSTISEVYESCRMHTDPADRLFYAISNALTMGYVMGYNAGKTQPKTNMDQ